MAPAEKGRKRNGKVEIKTAEEVLEEKQSKSKAKSEQDTELKISRVSFGIEKLDEALEGGVPKGSWVVIGGEPGTGKSIMAIHFAAAGLSVKDKIIYVTTEQEFF